MLLAWETIHDLTFAFARPNDKRPKVSKVTASVNVPTACPSVILTEMLPREVTMLEHQTFVSDIHVVVDAEVKPASSIGDRSSMPKFLPFTAQRVSDIFDI